MSYAVSGSLQKSVYGHLAGFAPLSALVGTHIYDAPLPLEGESAPTDYVTIGSETVRDRSSKTSSGVLLDLSVTVHSGAHGFGRSKAIAAAVCDALLDASLPLDRGEVVYLRFLKARADASGAPVRRSVALTFRAFVEDS